MNLTLSCKGCRHFSGEECRSAPPQVFGVAIPAPSSSITQPGRMEIQIQMSSAYPRPVARCSEYREPE
jgi:hypothetical protein